MRVRIPHYSPSSTPHRARIPPSAVTGGSRGPRGPIGPEGPEGRQGPPGVAGPAGRRGSSWPGILAGLLGGSAGGGATAWALSGDDDGPTPPLATVRANKDTGAEPVNPANLDLGELLGSSFAGQSFDTSDMTEAQREAFVNHLRRRGDNRVFGDLFSSMGVDSEQALERLRANAAAGAGPDGLSWMQQWQLADPMMRYAILAAVLGGGGLLLRNALPAVRNYMGARQQQPPMIVQQSAPQAPSYMPMPIPMGGAPNIFIGGRG